MVEVRLRAEADGDLVAILDYSIEAFGEAVGVDYVRSFERAFDLLRRHPQAGRLRTEIEPPIHSLPHRSHVIFYDLADDTVWIVRILHHAMDAKTRLSE